MSNRRNLAADQHLAGLSRDQIDDLEARFCEWQTYVNFSCVPCGLAFAFFCHWLLTSASMWLIAHDGVSGFRIPYQPVIWWFLPGFGGLCLCFEISLQVWSLFVGKKTMDLYNAWDSRQPKSYRGSVGYYDSRKWLRWFTLLLCLPIAVLTTLALNMHTSFAGDGIYEFGFAFKRPVFHGYLDLRRIAIVSGYRSGRHKEWIGMASVVLDFSDGHRWEQSKYDEDRSVSNLDQIEKILRARTSMEFVWASDVEELDGH